MVCLGNICRSPLAEGILKSKLHDAFEIDSAGTGFWHVGEQPDYRSIEVAKQFGIDITYQRARQISIDDFENFDIIFAMDSNNKKDLISLCENEHQAQKIKLILEEAELKETNVPDPYYGDEKDFLHVFNLLDKACGKLSKKLLRG